MRLAARRRGADDRALGQLVDRFGADQPVLHVAARPDGGDGDLARADRLHVLQGMDAEIDFLLDQRAVELLGPELLAADLRERAVLDPVARRLDHLDLHEVGRPAVRDLQRRGDLVGLRQCQGRTTRTKNRRPLHEGPASRKPAAPLAERRRLRQRRGRWR